MIGRRCLVTVCQEDQARFGFDLAYRIDGGVEAFGDFTAGRPGHTPVDFLQHLRQCPIVLTYLDGGKHYERAMRRKNCESGFRPAGEGPECGLDH